MKKGMKIGSKIGLADGDTYFVVSESRDVVLKLAEEKKFITLHDTEPSEDHVPSGDKRFEVVINSDMLVYLIPWRYVEAATGEAYEPQD